MTDSPRHGFGLLVLAQDAPETTVNLIALFIEQMANGAIVKDKDLAAPPGSPVDGDAYIVAPSPTGAWTGWAGRIAFYYQGWYDIIPIEGTRAYVQDEDAGYQYSGLAWQSEANLQATVTLTASEAISAGNFVSIHASSGAKIRKANATDDTKPVNGFAPSAISSSATGQVITPGQVLTGLSGLTAGSTYYLDTTGGAITSTPPSSAGNLVQEVGVALSATSLLFNPRQGITL